MRAPVHADGDAVVGEHVGEGLAGELAALVGFEDLRLAVARHGILQRLDAERRTLRSAPAGTERIDGLAFQLSLPARDLIGVDVELLGKLRNRSIALAASATFALKAGVWFWRARLLIVAPGSQAPACPLSGRNFTYRPVLNSGAGSVGSSR